MGILDLFQRKRINAVVPTGPVLYRFRAREDFWAAEVKTQYAKGSLYSVRRGNTKLADLVDRWAIDGKVEVI